MKIQAAVTYEKDGPFKIEDVELDEPKSNEILVKLVASGVCHTDEGARSQAIPVPLPAVLGHEGAGIVEKVGSAVTEFKPGDRVGISYAFCGKCDHCRTGNQHGCFDFNTINFGGIMPAGGTRLTNKDGKPLSTFFGQSSFATYAIADEACAVKVEDPDIDLALIGPLGCGVQTGSGTVLNRLKPEPGSSIAIFGCGTVGISAIMAAKIAGCSTIIGVDIDRSHLELARDLGATHVIDTSKVTDISGEIKKITKVGTQYAIDASGVPMLVLEAIKGLCWSGVAAEIGVGGDITFGLYADLMAEEKSLITSIEGYAVPKVYIPQLLKYYKEGRFPFDKLVTFYDFDDINDVFTKVFEKHEAVKAVMRIA